MRIAVSVLVSALVVWALASPRIVEAQAEDEAFCTMLSVVRGHVPVRVGDVVSGIAGPDAVTFRRTVSPGARYLLLVALSQPATGASVEPASRVGTEAPLREGSRIAHDFDATTRGSVTISFSAPAGTHHHAALYRLGPGPRGLSVRPSGIALHTGGGIGLHGERAPHPPDCEAVVSPRESGGTTARATARIGRFEIRGSMPRADIARVLSNNSASISFCAEANGAAAVTLSVVISPDGTVVSASGDGPARLAACLVRQARRWRFPSTGGGITTIEVPITFASR